jgi:hypothetical protein
LTRAVSEDAQQPDMEKIGKAGTNDLPVHETFTQGKGLPVAKFEEVLGIGATANEAGFIQKDFTDSNNGKKSLGNRESEELHDVQKEVKENVVDFETEEHLLLKSETEEDLQSNSEKTLISTTLTESNTNIVNFSMSEFSTENSTTEGIFQATEISNKKQEKSGLTDISPDIVADILYHSVESEDITPLQSTKYPVVQPEGQTDTTEDSSNDLISFVEVGIQTERPPVATDVFELAQKFSEAVGTTVKEESYFSAVPSKSVAIFEADLGGVTANHEDINANITEFNTVAVTADDSLNIESVTNTSTPGQSDSINDDEASLQNGIEDEYAPFIDWDANNSSGFPHQISSHTENFLTTSLSVPYINEVITEVKNINPIQNIESSSKSSTTIDDYDISFDLSALGKIFSTSTTYAAQY